MVSVELYQTKHGFVHLLIKPSSDPETYVVTVDSTTGNPMFVGIPMDDIFPDYGLAISYITEKFESKLRLKGEGLIGMAQADNQVFIAIIDKSETSGVLPGGHTIKVVKHVTFYSINTSNNKQAKNPFEDFQLNDNHYFCETYDLTRLYPSKFKPYEPDESFCWNNGWTKPFKDMGIRNCCITLMQGIGYTYEGPEKEYKIAHLCRRSSVNPGTRYAARGLNSKGSPGNEVEAELIFFKGENWVSARWRRGSIPIHWATVLNSKVSSPIHCVDKENYFEGTPEYFISLKERFGVPDIRCVSLLQTNESHSEAEILEYFKTAITRLYDAGVDNVFYTPFDLNQRLHEDGSDEAMNDFVSYIGPMMDDAGFNIGQGLEIKELQKSLLRFNCADSLDRTNLATFYFALFVTAKWCRENGYANKVDENALPNEVVPQHIIDFLAKSFVECGNIVAMLYTNTPAIKVKAIKKFSPSLENTSNDTAITLQRRLENVMNDPVRQRTIELWTDPTPLTWSHRLSHTYIRVIEGAPHMIVENTVSAFKLEKGTLIIGLQTPMLLTAVLVMFLPARDESPHFMKIETGLTIDDLSEIANLTLPTIENAMWSRYRVGMQEKWGYSHKGNKFIRFIKFTFSEEKPIVIGNIKIEAKSCPSQAGIITLQDCKQPDEQTLKRFDYGFNGFVNSKRTLSDALSLEKLRLGLHVPDEIRVELALKSGISPWQCDSFSRITAASNDFCCNCMKKLQENEMIYRMRQAWLLQGLIVEEDKLGQPKTINICQNCIDEIFAYSHGTEPYEDAYRTAVKPPKSPTITLPFNEVVDSTKDISSNTQAFVYKGNDKILTEKFEVKDSLHFTLSFTPNSILSFVCFDTDTEFQVKIQDKICQKVTLSDDRIIYKLEEPLISNLVDFEISCDGVHSVDNFRVFGSVMEINEQNPIDIKNYQGKVISYDIPVQMFTDGNIRQEKCQILDKNPIHKFVVEMRVGGPNNLSFVIQFKSQGKTVYEKKIILPETSPGNRMSFKTDCTQPCDAVVVNYLDRTSFFRQPLFRFIYKK